MLATALKPALYQKGDRLRVNKDVATPTTLPSYVGTVQDVVPCYGDETFGYTMVLDDDPRATRTWFFLQEQLSAVRVQRTKGSVAKV
jgi:hypothetical protein